MSPAALNYIKELDRAIDSLNYPALIKAGPKLWSALKYTGRAYPCSDRIAILTLDDKFNVLLDGFQENWSFSILRIGSQK